jgi:hypothetical protein
VQLLEIDDILRTTVAAGRNAVADCAHALNAAGLETAPPGASSSGDGWSVWACARAPRRRRRRCGRLSRRCWPSA